MAKHRKILLIIGIPGLSLGRLVQVHRSEIWAAQKPTPWDLSHMLPPSKTSGIVCCVSRALYDFNSVAILFYRWNIWTSPR